MLHGAWQQGGLDAVGELMAAVPVGFAAGASQGAVQGAAESRSSRPVVARPTVGSSPGEDEPGPGSAAGGMGRRRVLVHSSGFAMSPYADIKPAGEDTKSAARRSGAEPPRKLWHSSSGSSGG